MAEYKQTLNLPQTDFPMKADLAQREAGIQKGWDDSGLYQKMREVARGRPRFRQARPRCLSIQDRQLRADRAL